MPNGTYANPQYNVAGDASPNPARNVVYAITAGGLNDLDVIARYVLAAAHSGQWTPTNVQNAGVNTFGRTATERANREQSFVGQRTVAVARHNNEVFIAANGLWSDEIEDMGTSKQRVMDEVAAAGIHDRIVFIPNRRGEADMDLHAEVQIVNYFFARAWRLDGDMIGVSKPCCHSCATRLDALNITYSYWHQEPIGNRYVPAMANRQWW